MGEGGPGLFMFAEPDTGIQALNSMPRCTVKDNNSINTKQHTKLDKTLSHSMYPKKSYRALIGVSPALLRFTMTRSVLFVLNSSAKCFSCEAQQ